MKNSILALLGPVAGMFALCTAMTVSCQPSTKMEKRPFGTLSTGEETTLYTIVNKNGASMQVLDYGARIVSIKMPDRNGKVEDVVVGFGDIGNFEKTDRFIGCVIGRYGNRIDMTNEHLRIMHGMSACWVVRDWDGTLRKVATLYDRKSGRGVETWTTEPALLTFTGRTFSGEKYQGKYGPIEKFGGMLLETIHFPDSPNQSRFLSTVLRPGEKYSSATEFRFYAE